MTPSLLTIYFQPSVAAATDSYVVVYAASGGPVMVGEALLEASSVSGLIRFASPCDGNILESHLVIGQKIQFGAAICQMRSNCIGIDECGFEKLIERKLWDLAIATNAAFKGLLGSMGASGHIAAKCIPVKVELPEHQGLEALVIAIATAVARESLTAGDVVVVAEKPFAVAQGRLVPFELIANRDPKKLDAVGRKVLLDELAGLVDTPIDDTDLILSDTYLDHPSGRKMATVGAYGHNNLAYKTAAKIFEFTGIKVDVVISDTDTGVDVREKLIGCITLTATPLGATRGLTLYECMRVACAAEFTRGSKWRIPIVVCQPIDRNRNRGAIGMERNYSGKLSLQREGIIAFA